MSVAAFALALLAAPAPAPLVSPSFSPPPRSVAQKGGELAALEKQLDDASEKRRRAAVQELAERGTTEAWALVVGALADDEAMVADEAQLQLGKLEGAAALELLAGKKGLESGNAWVRLRAAEALGRVREPTPLALLAGGLDDKDARVRRAACWSIERRAGLAAPGNQVKDELAPRQALARATQDKDVLVRAAAIVATVASLPPKPESLAPELFADKASEVRVAALLGTSRWPAEARFTVAQRLLADPSYAVRAQAIETLAACRTKAACALLVERLEKETSLRLRWRIVGELQQLSGSDLELNPAYWKKWVDALDDSWEPKTAEPNAKKRETKAPEGTTVFLGLPVLSERIAILVDFSGSTWEERADGKTRKETLDEELAGLLKQLTPATKFNVIPYTKDPLPWQRTLVAATPDNVAKALDFFTKCKESGKGNVWDAIELAAKDPEVDTLIVLTDGAPTGGHRWNLELMEPLLAEHLRFSKIAVDAILVDASRFLRERWERITSATGGRMQSVEMK